MLTAWGGARARRLVLPVCVSVLAATGSALAAGGRSAGAGGRAAYMIQLDGAPSARVSATARSRGASRAAAGSQAREQRRRNDADQADVAAAARRAGLFDRELFRVGTVYNGIAVITTARDAARIAALDGVRAVVPLPSHERDNGYTDPYIGATTAWTAAGGSLTGAGIKAAVIDTGIDYVHRNFGGRGTAADLTAARDAANNPAQSDAAPSGFTVSSDGTPIFPSAKVAGGFDLVGDAYTGDNAPAPDPNPEDCPSSLGGGHGSHVAGTLGGLGVKADGTTFDGSYDGLDTTTMKIGPGVAPGVTLYAVRVFGCTGSTNLTARALEWVADPNHDGDLSDHLDVANLSLGSSFGAADDPSAVAATAAAAAGVAIVISAGNSGDTTFVSGSPGSSPRALTVANMNAGETRDGFLLTSTDSSLSGLKPASESVNYNWAAMASPVTAPLVAAPAGNESGCSPFTAGSLSGKIVLLDWRPAAGQPFPCGSTARTNNAQSAGAVGVIMADPEPLFTTSISGNNGIPAVYTNKPVQDDLKASLIAGVTTVTLSHEYAASSHDAAPVGTLNASSSRGPTGLGGLKPDIAAPGSGILSTNAGSGNAGRVLSGTSMAAPAAAGAIALLRQRHPTWSVEELKALAMNTASRDIFTLPGLTGDRYAPQRVGAGTVQVATALEDDVVAYAAAGGGTVSASFGPLAVPPGAAFERERTITVVNHADSARSYTPSFVAGTAVPGVAFDFPDGSEVSVAAGASTTFRVRLRVADPSALRNVRDPTLAATQLSTARAYLAEASGLVRLASAGHPTLSVPVHASIRPVDDLVATRHALGTTAATGSGTITLTGSPVQTGSGATDFRSKITPLELQASSPQISFPAGTQERNKGADLRYVGVGINGANIVFGVATWGPRAAPGSNFAEFDVSIDSDRNGSDDYVIYNDRRLDGSTGTDVYVTWVYRYATGTSTPVALPLSPAATTAAGGLFDTDVLSMQVPLSAVGLAPATSHFDYAVKSYAVGSDPVDTTPKLTYDYLHPGVTFTANASALVDDVAGALAFSYDQANLTANGSSGALLLHHLGAPGHRAEVFRIAPQSAPVIATSGPYSVTEGQAASLNAGGSSDIDEDPLSFAWDLDDNGSFETSGATASSGVLDDGPGTRTVHVRVSDGVGAPVEAAVPITIANAAPTVTATVTGSPASGLHLAAIDPSAADQAAGFSFAVDVGADGSVERTASGAAADVAYPFAGTTTVRVTATDKDGAASAPVDIVATGPAPITSPLVPVTPVTPVTPAPTKRCVVPSLKGKTLKRATAALKKAGCALGKVTKPRKAKGTLIVSTQSLKAKRVLKAGTKVAVKLKVKPKKKRS